VQDEPMMGDGADGMQEGGRGGTPPPPLALSE